MAAAGSSFAGTAIKRPARGRPFPSNRACRRSVSGDDRTAEAVVHADGAHVDVLTDIVAARHGNGRYREGHVGIAHEQMVVLDADGPVRCKTDFDTGSDGGT